MFCNPKEKIHIDLSLFYQFSQSRTGAFMSAVTTEHPGGMCDRSGSFLHWLQRLLRPALHCNWSLSGSVTSIMTSSPPRGEKEREGKTVCTHPSMSVSNYNSTNHRRGSIGSGWAGWEGQVSRREEEEERRV